MEKAEGGEGEPEVAAGAVTKSGKQAVVDDEAAHQEKEAPKEAAPQMEVPPGEDLAAAAGVRC